MKISAEKIKLMTNSDSTIQKEIKVNGQKLGTETNFKYLRVQRTLVITTLFVNKDFAVKSNVLL